VIGFLVWSVAMGFLASEVWLRRARVFRWQGMGMRADVERLNDMARVCITTQQ